MHQHTHGPRPPLCIVPLILCIWLSHRHVRWSRCHVEVAPRFPPRFPKGMSPLVGTTERGQNPLEVGPGGPWLGDGVTVVPRRDEYTSLGQACSVPWQQTWPWAPLASFSLCDVSSLMCSYRDAAQHIVMEAGSLHYSQTYQGSALMSSKVWASKLSVLCEFPSLRCSVTAIENELTSDSLTTNSGEWQRITIPGILCTASPLYHPDDQFQHHLWNQLMVSY